MLIGVCSYNYVIIYKDVDWWSYNYVIIYKDVNWWSYNYVILYLYGCI